MQDRIDIKVLLDTAQFNKELAALRNAIAKLGEDFNNALDINIPDVSPTINNINKSANRFNDTALKTWASTRGWRDALYQLSDGFLSLGRVLYDLMKSTAIFDDKLRGASAVTGTFAEAIEEFAPAAKLMGETTRYTADEAAEALQNLAMAGLSVKEAVQALPATLQLAQAANIEIAESADLVTNVMAQYGIKATDLGRAVDGLVATFTSTNTGLRELAKAFSYAGPIAHASNMSFEQTNAILGVMANNGYKSGRAGRALANALARIQMELPALVKVTSAFGIQLRDVDNVFGEGQKQMRPFVDILTDFSRSGMAVGDVMKAVGMIAGPATQALVSGGTKQIKIQEALLYGFSREGDEVGRIVGGLYDYVEALATGGTATNEVAEKLKYFGVNVMDSYGALKSMPMIFTELANAGQDASVIGDIFGDVRNLDALTNAFISVSASAIGGKISVKDMETALSQVSQTGKTVADQMESGVGGSWRILESSWEALNLELGKGFESRAQEGLIALSNTLNTNRESLVQFASKVLEIVAKLTEWAISLFAVIGNNQTLLTTVGLLLIALKAIHLQIVELTAVMLGKLTVSLLGLVNTAALTTTGLTSMSFSMGVFKGALIATAGFLGRFLILLGLLVTMMAPLIIAGTTLVAVLEGVSRLVFNQSFITSISDAITATTEWVVRSKDLTSALYEIQTAQLKIAAVSIKPPQMSTEELIQYRDELISLISKMEGMEAIGKLDEDQLDQLSDLKTKLSEVRQEYMTPERQAAIAQIEKMKAAYEAQNGTLKTTIKSMDDFHETLGKVSDVRFDEIINKLTSELNKFDIAMAESGSEVGQQALIEAKRSAALQILDIERQRTEATIALYDKQQAAAIAAAESAVDSEEVKDTQIETLEYELLGKKLSAQETLKKNIEASLQEAVNNHRNYVNQVVELEKNIANERIRQADVLRNLNRQGMTEAEVVEDKKRQLSELTAQYKESLERGNLERALEIAKQQESLAIDIGNAEVASKRKTIDEMVELGRMTEERAEIERRMAADTSLVGTKEQVLEAQQRINEVLAEQKTIAEQNKAAELAQINTLTTAMEAVAGKMEELRNQQLNFNIGIIGIDTVKNEITELGLELNKPVEKKIVFIPEGSGINQFLDGIKAKIESMKSGMPGFKQGKRPGGFATGGIVSGLGTSTSDSILARVSRGEAIIPANVVTQFGKTFFNDLINGKVNLPAFAMGGIVGSANESNASLQPINIVLGNKKIPLYARAETTKEVLRGIEELLR